MTYSTRVKVIAIAWLLLTGHCASLPFWMTLPVESKVVALSVVIIFFKLERFALAYYIWKRFSIDYNTARDLRNRVIELEKANWELQRENAALNLSSLKLEEKLASSQAPPIASR